MSTRNVLRTVKVRAYYCRSGRAQQQLYHMRPLPSSRALGGSRSGATVGTQLEAFQAKAECQLGVHRGVGAVLATSLVELRRARLLAHAYGMQCRGQKCAQGGVLESWTSQSCAPI